jgi:hypothetical protein
MTNLRGTKWNIFELFLHHVEHLEGWTQCSHQPFNLVGSNMVEMTVPSVVYHMNGKFHCLLIITATQMVLVDNSGGPRKMNVLYRTGCP